MWADDSFSRARNDEWSDDSFNQRHGFGRAKGSEPSQDAFTASTLGSRMKPLDARPAHDAGPRAAPAPLRRGFTFTGKDMPAAEERKTVTFGEPPKPAPKAVASAHGHLRRRARRRRWICW
jgi:hypothetical protein